MNDLKTNHEWNLVNDDTMQHYRYVGVFNDKNAFELYQINSYNAFDSNKRYYCVAHGFVYLADFSDDTLNQVANLYGYTSAKEIPETILASKLFELAGTICDLPLEFSTWEAAKEDLLERIRASKKIKEENI